jgi:putative hydrolase of the HAD superfamily
MTERPLTTLLLDCDGVIRHWDQDQFAALAGFAGCSARDLAAIAFEEELLRRAMVGEVTAEGWADEIGRRAAAAHGCDAVVVASRFGELGWQIDEAVLGAARRVREAGNRVGILSNASTRLEDDLLAAGVSAEVDVVLSSARLGITKPDPAIFRVAAQAMEAEPAQCLFIDDQSSNVVGAREAGMSAEVFMGAGALVTLLDRAGLFSRQ